MRPKFLVYGLVHPITGELRYVGKSSSGLDRPKSHGAPSNLEKNGKYPVVRWIKKLLSEGLEYRIEVLEHCTKENLDKCEVNKIAYWRSFPEVRLLNISDGGAGGASGCKHWTGRKHTEETKIKQSKAKLGKKQKPEHIAARAAKRTGVKRGPRSEEHKRNISKGKKGQRPWLGKHHSEESKKRISEAKICAYRLKTMISSIIDSFIVACPY